MKKSIIILAIVACYFAVKMVGEYYGWIAAYIALLVIFTFFWFVPLFFNSSRKLHDIEQAIEETREKASKYKRIIAGRKASAEELATIRKLKNHIFLLSVVRKILLEKDTKNYL